MTNGRIEIDNNSPLGRLLRNRLPCNSTNALFAGHDAGADKWGVIVSLIETCKINAGDPHAWLASTLQAIVSGHKQSQILDPQPWNYARKM